MAENNRVLNHSEFAAKYNQQSEQDIAASYSEMESASDNFQEGFDETSYEDGQTGPKRPIAQGNQETPDSPDSMPTQPTEGMAAPTEEEDHITPEEIENDFESEEDEEDDFEDDGSGDPESGNPEEGSEDEEDDEEDEEDDEEETNESVKVIKNRIILESFDDFEARGPISIPSNAREDIYQDELEAIELDFEGDEEDEECFVTCKSCGSKKEIERGSYPMGVANQEDPNSWWQGAKMGMMCESCK